MRKFVLIGFSFFFMAVNAQAAPAGPAPAPANAIPASVYGASTVSAFLAACRVDQGGCIDEVGTALMDKMDYSGTSHVCISSPDYGNAVPGWLSAHPQTASMATEDGIYLAIRTLYPCG